MTELKIDLLKLNIENGAGHEHRVGPITERAVGLLTEKLGIYLESPGCRPALFEMLNGAADLNLNATSDEQAAQVIADAWLQALMLRLKS